MSDDSLPRFWPDAASSAAPGAASHATPRPVAVALVGPGHVGRALLGQLAAAGPALRRTGRVDLRVVAIAASRRMKLARDLELDTAIDLDTPIDLDALAAHLREMARDDGAAPVLVDCTASNAVADRYVDWLEAGIHVVTPNKHAGAGPMARYRDIRSATRTGGGRWRYEATVGAGLPVVGTLQDLLATGDELVAVEGVLSGTLAYLLSEREAGRPFSESIPRARELGYSEPDPREDLSGMDVARKMVILAREGGASVDVGEVRIEGLVPPALAGGSVDDFIARLDELDAAVEARFGSLHRPGRPGQLGQPSSPGDVIRYVGRFTPGEGIRVGPVALAADHPFAALGPTGNAVAFTTRRYRATPLTVQGPGAGPDVTAAAVFADLLRVAESA